MVKFCQIWSLCWGGNVINTFYCGIIKESNLDFLDFLQNNVHKSDHRWSMFLYKSPTPTIIAFTGITNAQGPQPNACRSMQMVNVTKKVLMEKISKI